MKLFDVNNSRHIEILREELARAKKLYESYNEKEIWDVLSIEQREEALLSVDDDMGPDFADEYSGTDWMQIPDTITNRIDLHQYHKNDYVSHAKRNAGTMQRGIASIMTDTDRFKNTKEMQDYVAKEIGSSSADVEKLKADLQQYARTYPGQMTQFNIEVQKLAQPHVSTSPGAEDWSKTNPDFNPLDFIRRPGSNWTGD